MARNKMEKKETSLRENIGWLKLWWRQTSTVSVALFPITRHFQLHSLSFLPSLGLEGARYVLV